MRGGGNIAAGELIAVMRLFTIRNRRPVFGHSGGGRACRRLSDIGHF
jgi:hypothetical protein